MNVVVHTITEQLPDVAQGLARQMTDLAVCATPALCERALVNLRGAQHTVLRLREALERDSKERAGGG